ncbi:acyl-CoA reductase-like NAD-dependent aldehyde dehydrogenase [Variovorax boronicumulans]|uniref:4-(hydroxymethyl)benzenesulfonate dehydrogenase n=1 Tax=Variovorax boronicumulans TaxID=436515 RepID=A0AAW8DTZ0_9BURK|nr:aldehyde dehydrogenase family protein [Variovorax boronicumulans]MDP9877653.1 acyl-CoA reductase-like NAD-dependent aldehyde dehydrogenase [Variovorax boronicumulans]MDP9922938.1 acyl-CoA reductase-like NAD-dependent aldehyde dehydrogenase [Variovorax boronicumulans]
MSNPFAFTMTIHGEGISSPVCFDVINPATEQVVAVAPDATVQHLDEAVSSARRAAPGWAALPLTERQRYVTRIGMVLLDNAEELADLLTREQGKPRAQAYSELQAAALWCSEMSTYDIPVLSVTSKAPETVNVYRIPLGVVGGIVPWNFPVALAFWKIAPALLTGNTMVLKPSPFTPLTTLRIGELLRNLLPPGVLNIVSGTDALGPLMSAHPGIDKISFTGSTQTGRRVMASAAVNLKRLTLELGGNDAAIVLPDVDVDEVAPQLFWGAFRNSAQICIAIKRLYIHEDIYDRLAQALVQLAKDARIGSGTDESVQLGPVQNRPQFERLKGLLEDSRRNGHHFLSGGSIPEGRGYFLPITLVDNPPDDSRVVQEEAFGPILPLLRFKGIDEVVRRANDSEFGLAASVWSRDEDSALQIARHLEVGTVWINEIHTSLPNKPMAGHKQSGIGVENGEEGLLEYTAPQTVSIKRVT